MAISKHSFASTRYRFTSRRIYNYPGDEIPTRSVGHRMAKWHTDRLDLTGVQDLDHLTSTDDHR